MVVAEIMTKAGVRVRIRDDYMAPRGSEEERRIIERQNKVARDILIKYALRMREQEKQQEDTGNDTALLDGGAAARGH